MFSYKLAKNLISPLLFQSMFNCGRFVSNLLFWSLFSTGKQKHTSEQCALKRAHNKYSIFHIIINHGYSSSQGPSCLCQAFLQCVWGPRIQSRRCLTLTPQRGKTGKKSACALALPRNAPSLSRSFSATLHFIISAARPH